MHKWLCRFFLNAALFCYEHPDIAKILEDLKNKN